MAESSNKSLVRIIKKLLEDNKKSWHAKLVHAIWADMISTKKSISTSPFKLVYCTDVVFLVSLGVLLMKLLQDEEAEPNPVQRRINQLIQVQQKREEVFNHAQLLQEKMKNMIDKKTKTNDFKTEGMVLKWNSSKEDKGKHGKFDHLWIGPCRIAAYKGNNAFILKDLEGILLEGGPVNGRHLKHYIT